MVRMQIRGGIKWPVGIDFSYIPCPGRTQTMGDLKRIIRLARHGCTNRPFYHIEVTKERFPKLRFIDPIEQVGTYDPLPNEHGEKLVSLNLERITYYLAQGIKVDPSVASLLGLAGLLPLSPEIYKNAWRNREEINFELEQKTKSSEQREAS